MISFELDSDQTLIQETLRTFAKDELAPAARAAEKAREPLAQLRRSYAELGVARLDLPEDQGGQSATLITTMIAEEQLGWGDAALALALDAGYAGACALWILGDESTSARYAKLPGTIGLAYCEAKAPPTGFSTTARRMDGGYVLTGKKSFVLEASTAARFVVLAQLDGIQGWAGAAAFIVERDDKSLRSGPRHTLLGLDAAAIGEVILEDCRVGDSALLASGDALIAGMREVLARVGLKNAARQVGLGRAAYELALEYTQERKAFGRVVAHFQANAFMLADMLTDIEAARWLVWRAALALDKAKDPLVELRLVSNAIVQAADAAWRTADRGVQLLGGAGFVQDFPAEQRMRDTKALALVGAPSEWWRLDAAGRLLDHALESALPSASIQPFVL